MFSFNDFWRTNDEILYIYIIASNYIFVHTKNHLWLDHCFLVSNSRTVIMNQLFRGAQPELPNLRASRIREGSIQPFPLDQQYMYSGPLQFTDNSRQKMSLELSSKALHWWEVVQSKLLCKWIFLHWRLDILVLFLTRCLYDIKQSFFSFPIKLYTKNIQTTIIKIKWNMASTKFYHSKHYI
jgi:hypothetical protein